MTDDTHNLPFDDLKIVTVSNPAQRALGMQIRKEVFVLEQGVALHQEIDGKDETATQYLVFLGRLAIGTARSRTISGSEEKVERVSIINEYRGLGIGNKLMKRIMHLIEMRGIEKVTIHAQVDVVSFYRRLNFVTNGPEFVEAGIVHQKMTAILIHPKE